MVQHTPTWGLPMPAPGDSVKPQSRDFTDLAVLTEAAMTMLLTEAKEYADSRAQDTGWRDITSGLVNGWVASSVQTRRVDTEVFYRFTELDASNATHDMFYSPTAGFRTVALAKDVYLGGQHTVILSNATGELQTPRVGFEFQTYFRCEFNHSTSNAFPDPIDYPGTAI